MSEHPENSLERSYEILRELTIRLAHALTPLVPEDTDNYADEDIDNARTALAEYDALLGEGKR